MGHKVNSDRLRFMIELSDRIDPRRYCLRVARLIYLCNENLKMVYSRHARSMVRQVAREYDFMLNNGYDPILLDYFYQLGAALVQEHLTEYGATFIFIRHTYKGMPPKKSPFARAHQLDLIEKYLPRISPVLGYHVPAYEPATEPGLAILADPT